MTQDAAGNDLARVFVPVTGSIGFGPDDVAVPTPSEIADPDFTVPNGIVKLGLVKTDGGPEWTGEPSGDAIDFWQDSYSIPSGQVDATIVFTLAQTDPRVREFTSGKKPDGNGVIDVELASNAKVYTLYVEEVAKNLDIRRRWLPNVQVTTVKEDKSERGTVLGYAVTCKINRSPKISGAHYREVIIPGNADNAAKTDWTVTIGGEPSGGTFSLVLNGAETAPIAYDAAAQAVTTALNGLSGVTGISGISTSGTGPYTVTLPTTAVLAAGDNDLTGGTAPSVTVE